MSIRQHVLPRFPDFVLAVLNGETPKPVSANVRAGFVRNPPADYSGPYRDLPQHPAIFSYGDHFPMLVCMEPGTVWYNTDRYSAMTAGHQAAIRYALEFLNYVPTEVTQRVRFAGSGGYLYRAYRRKRDAPGFVPCESCGVYFADRSGLAEHLRTEHPRKGRDQLDTLTHTG